VEGLCAVVAGGVPTAFVEPGQPRRGIADSPSPQYQTNNNPTPDNPSTEHTVVNIDISECPHENDHAMLLTQDESAEFEKSAEGVQHKADKEAAWAVQVDPSIKREKDFNVQDAIVEFQTEWGKNKDDAVAKWRVNAGVPEEVPKPMDVSAEEEAPLVDWGRMPASLSADGDLYDNEVEDEKDKDGVGDEDEDEVEDGDAAAVPAEFVEPVPVALPAPRDSVEYLTQGFSEANHEAKFGPLMYKQVRSEILHLRNDRILSNNLFESNGVAGLFNGAGPKNGLLGAAFTDVFEYDGWCGACDDLKIGKGTGTIDQSSIPKMSGLLKVATNTLAEAEFDIMSGNAKDNIDEGNEEFNESVSKSMATTLYMLDEFQDKETVFEDGDGVESVRVDTVADMLVSAIAGIGAVAVSGDSTISPKAFNVLCSIQDLSATLTDRYILQEQTKGACYLVELYLTLHAYRYERHC